MMNKEKNKTTTVEEPDYTPSTFSSFEDLFAPLKPRRSSFSEILKPDRSENCPSIEVKESPSFESEQIIEVKEHLTPLATKELKKRGSLDFIFDSSPYSWHPQRPTYTYPEVTCEIGITPPLTSSINTTSISSRRQRRSSLTQSSKNELLPDPIYEEKDKEIQNVKLESKYQNGEELNDDNIMNRIAEAIMANGGKATGSTISNWIAKRYVLPNKRMSYTVNAILSSKKHAGLFRKETVIVEGNKRALWSLADLDAFHVCMDGDMKDCDKDDIEEESLDQTKSPTEKEDFQNTPDEQISSTKNSGEERIEGNKDKADHPSTPNEEERAQVRASDVESPKSCSDPLQARKEDFLASCIKEGLQPKKTNEDLPLPDEEKKEESSNVLQKSTENGPFHEETDQKEEIMNKVTSLSNNELCDQTEIADDRDLGIDIVGPELELLGERQDETETATYTKLIEHALRMIGGRGTGLEITNYLEYNCQDSLSCKAKTWKHSVIGCLSSNRHSRFVKEVSKSNSRRYVWRLNDPSYYSSSVKHTIENPEVKSGKKPKLNPDDEIVVVDHIPIDTVVPFNTQKGLGTNYLQLIEDAFTDFGGKATGADVTEWIAQRHPELGENKKRLSYSVNAILSSKKYSHIFTKDQMVAVDGAIGSRRILWKMTKN